MDLTPDQEIEGYKEFEVFKKWYYSRVSKVVFVPILGKMYLIDNVYRNAEEVLPIYEKEQGNKEVINPLEHKQSK